MLPLLESELGPGVAPALARTADLLRADVEHLDDLAETAYAALPDAAAGRRRCSRLAPAVRTRVLRLAALRAGARDAELFHDHVRALDALLTDWHGQGAGRPAWPRARRTPGRDAAGRSTRDRPGARTPACSTWLTYRALVLVHG